MRQAFWTLASWGLASCPISTSVNASACEEPISTAITETFYVPLRQTTPDATVAELTVRNLSCPAEGLDLAEIMFPLSN